VRVLTRTGQVIPWRVNSSALFQGAYACGGGGGGGGGRRLSIGLFAPEHSPRKFSPFDTRPMRVRLLLLSSAPSVHLPPCRLAIPERGDPAGSYGGVRRRDSGNPGWRRGSLTPSGPAGR